MLLVVDHPGFRSCDDCVAWLHDDRVTKPPVFGQRKMLRGKPVARPKGSKPPCSVCPKCHGEPIKTPAVGRQAELSEKNRKTWQLYQQLQASCGRAAIELDDVAARNVAIIHELVTNSERLQRKALLQVLATVPKQ